MFKKYQVAIGNSRHILFAYQQKEGVGIFIDMSSIDQSATSLSNAAEHLFWWVDSSVSQIVYQDSIGSWSQIEMRHNAIVYSPVEAPDVIEYYV